MTVFGYIAIRARRRIPAVVQFLVRLRGDLRCSYRDTGSM
jgi:hypothetical protein